MNTMSDLISVIIPVYNVEAVSVPLCGFGAGSDIPEYGDPSGGRRIAGRLPGHLRRVRQTGRPGAGDSPGKCGTCPGPGTQAST